MAAIQNFRSALNGFNREDVVRYIELINNKHNSQLNQYKTQLQAVQAELKELREKPVMDPLLPEQLEQAKQQCQTLEAELAQLKESSEAKLAQVNLEHVQELESLRAKLTALQSQQESELEAYRRAERAERLAKERVDQLYHQANGVLADACVNAEALAARITAAADSAAAQVAELQAVLTEGKSALDGLSATLGTISLCEETA